MATPTATAPSYEELLRENERLRTRLQQLEQHAAAPASSNSEVLPSPPATAAPIAAASPAASASLWSHGLTSPQITRYSRQLLLSELGGADTQARLLRSRVLVVGAGGLGAPVCLYLAAAGVGAITVVDADEVELSNLHRQVIHTEASIGEAKAKSAARACMALNSDVRVKPVVARFTESNALELASDCDVLVDASDNVATRYLVNDVGIALGKPVVSGSALRLEGQVSVFGLHGGPCYRCMFPQPPPPGAVTNCSDGGVLGAITGIIGSIQALEVVKVLAGLVVPATTGAGASAPAQAPLSATSTRFDPVAAASNMSSLNSKLLLFDGSTSSFRCVRVRARNPNCAVCGDAPTITRETLQAQALDYQLFCASAFHDGPSSAPRVSAGPVPTATVTQLRSAFDAAASSSHIVAASSTPVVPLLLDVREPVQFRICALPGAVNVPLRVLKQGVPAWLQRILRGQVSDATSRPKIAIRQLTEEDWPLWRELRLQALADSPACFNSKLADWQGAGDLEERWRHRFTAVPFNIAATIDGVPCGMAGAVLAADGANVHSGGGGQVPLVDMISVWVSPSARGRGVGDALIRTVEQWARGVVGASKLRLGVKGDNVIAQALYERNGFARASAEEAGPKVSPDDISLIKQLTVVTCTDATSTAPSIEVRSTCLHPGAGSNDCASRLAAPPRDVFVMCRRGVDSATATRLLLQACADAQTSASSEGGAGDQKSANAPPVVRHVAGGLQSWCEQIDASFPLY